MTTPLKVLILEDNPADAEFIKRELKKAGMEFSYALADTKKEFIDGVTGFQPDLILSDHSLPQFNSIEALRIAKEHIPDIPFILVTGAVSEEFAVQVLKEGADDYILKNHLVRLPSAIQNALKKKAAEKEREEMLGQVLLSNNELNTFVYKATHDLRGPLTSIIGLTMLAEREENKPHASAYLKMIADSTQKLDDILVSLIETMAIKNAPLNITEINIGKLLDAILKRLEFSKGFSRMIIDIKISARKKFLSDEKIINSILQNIIENAIKYQDHSIPDPQVLIHVFDGPNGTNITIADNGIGIITNIRDKVFNMFYRGHEGSKGSGLGLYLAKNGVQRLGGSIHLQSDVSKGTSISLTFPKAELIPELVQEK